ncbi:MAG: S-layer homology domain-containing protein [Clostridia bacterium]|nr:S-layer homology domain-containing protein [Clostridia bacterium]
MKFSKRILCTLLAVFVTLTSLAVVPAAAAFTDLEEGHNAYEAVNVLSKLGVINGYADGSFRPTNNVTRAEFTAMLLRTRGLGSVGSTSLENPPFPDVTTPDVSWAIGNIRTAREMGIINGYDDGTFKPNNNVLYEEAVKMIVCALGYGEMGAEGAQWFSKYLMTATSLGFTDGAGGVISVPATRATIAKMLYNCLEVKLAENNTITDKTILEDDLKLTKNVGYISSNSKISLSKRDANLRDDEVEITVNGIASTYKVDDAAKYEDMLGAQIEFYFKNDFGSGLKHLILATVKNSTTVKIDADSIQNGSTSGISYLKSEDAQRETNASIASNSVVVYNGKLYGADAATSTFATYFTGEGIPLVGDMELIDRDGDNVFDVVFVNDYEPYFVSAVTSSDYKITDNALRSGSQETLNYKANNIEFVTKDGAATSFSAIKKGSVIFVAKAKGSTGDAKVIVCNDTVSGKITATSSSKGITVNGKNYKFSSLAPWKTSLGGSPLTAPEMGDTAKFYLDLKGKIIWYDKTETASTQQYGYITGAKYDSSDFDETAQVMIVTKSNVKGTVYTITTKSKIDGSIPATLNNFVTALDNANDGAENDDFKQLVKFTVSKGTEIDEIITATSTSATPEKIADDTLNLYSLITDQTDCKYSSNRFEAVSGGKKINVSKAFILDLRTPGKYSLLTTSKLKNAASGYKIECFDVDSTNFAKVVLVYDVPVTANIGEVDEKSPVFVIDGVIHKQDGDYTRYLLSGWLGTEKHGEEPGEKEPLKLSVEDASTVGIASTLQKGDVVRLGTDSEGYYTIKHEAGKQHIIFRMDAGYRSTLSNPCQTIHGNTSYPEYEVIWGTLYERSNTALMVSKSMLTGVEAENALNLREDAIMPSAFSGAQILVFKMENGKLNIYKEAAPTVNGDETNWGYIEGLNKFTNNNGDAPAEIFMHLNNGKVKTMIIVER